MTSADDLNHLSNPDAARLVGQVVVGRYRVRSVIAGGSNGDIYDAVQLPIGRKVALKILRVGPDDPSAPLYRKRFHREASSAARLAHPNVVTVFDFGQTEQGDLFIAMEFLAGRPLGDVLRDAGRFDMRRALNIAIQIVRALRKAHELGVVHRDLKPANIMLTPDDDELDFVKVLDFGIVKIFSPDIQQVPGAFSDDNLTNAGILLGTPGYMAPEQAVGEEVDARADVYSIGVLLHQMLTGKPPYVAPSISELIRAQVMNDPPFITETEPDADCSRELEMLVQRCLDRRRDARPASAQALLGELKTIWRMETDESFGTEVSLTGFRADEVSSITVLPEESLIEDPSLVGAVVSTVQLDALKPPSRRWLWILVVAIFVIVGLAGGLWLGRGPGEPPLEIPVKTDSGKAVLEPDLPEGDADAVGEEETYKDNPY